MPSNPDVPKTASPPRRRLLIALLHPKVSIPVAVLAALLTMPLAYRGSRIAGLPDLGHPFDVEKDGTIAIAPEDNAFDDYVAAARSLTPLASDLYDWVGKPWSDVPEPVRLWMGANRPALERWKAGTAKPDAICAQPQETDDDSIGARLSIVRDMRQLAVFAQLDASRLEEEGNLAEAWTMYRALFRSSRHFGRAGGMIERFAGNAIQAAAVIRIERWSRDPRVKAGELERALRDLQEDDRLTAPTAMTLKVEYFFVNRMLHDRDRLEQYMDVQTDAERASPTLRKARLFLAHEPLNSFLVLRQVYANLLEHIDKPLHERPSIHPGKLSLFASASLPLPPNRLPAERIEYYFERAPVLSGVAPEFEQFFTAVTRERARQATLVVALAAQLHRHKTGEFPETADELVETGILEELPRDPFSPTGNCILYRKSGDRAVVWSVADDGTDGGGNVTWSAAGRPPDIGYTISAEPDELKKV